MPNIFRFLPSGKSKSLLKWLKKTNRENVLCLYLFHQIIFTICIRKHVNIKFVFLILLFYSDNILEKLKYDIIIVLNVVTFVEILFINDKYVSNCFSLDFYTKCIMFLM